MKDHTIPYPQNQTCSLRIDMEIKLARQDSSHDLLCKITEKGNLNSHYGNIYTMMNHISVSYYTYSSKTISYYISRALGRSLHVHSFLAVLKTVKEKKVTANSSEIKRTSKRLVTINRHN